MPQSSPSVKPALTAFACVCSQICMRDIVEEFVAFGVDSLQREIEMPKVPRKQSLSKLMRLPYLFDPDFQGFKSPNAAWKREVTKATKSLIGVSYPDYAKLHIEKKKEKKSPSKAGTSRASERIIEKKKPARDTSSPLPEEGLVEVKSPQHTIFSKQPKTPSITKALKVLGRTKRKLSPPNKVEEEVKNFSP